VTEADIARTVLDTNSFMTLATADESGMPWATPVWYATEDYRELYWVSSPSSRHSQNLAVRPTLSIVVFDSTVQPNSGQAVYLAATATQVPDPDLERGLAVFSRVAVRSGLPAWHIDRVTGNARLRLYRATATEHYILDPDAPIDTRIPITP
jgi:nitroimidazol reductase NimA-like FMN-containing flavoprotein (pyridoxamine 5'-phosphate oxidase superfamily)